MLEYVALERRWVDVAAMMPRALKFAAAVALEGKLLVIGGIDSDNRILSAVLQYDTRSGSWEELPSMLSARACCAATVLQGEVVVLGGWRRRALGPSVERYNRQLQCWEAMASLTTSLHQPAAVVVRV
mmetsp:Transcript_118657/g.206634  ORF Transcript_118657/g.206634 Transcript_118657/m.206634 type:complete len:128 (-) Transcript_118657:279-662(-)